MKLLLFCEQKTVESMASLKQHGQGGDAEHGEKGGDEGHFCDHSGVLFIFQTQDRTISGYGHGDDQCVDVNHQR